MTLITRAEFARRKKVTRAAVSQWQHAGRLKMIGKLVDLEATEESMIAGASHRSKRKNPARQNVKSKAPTDVVNLTADDGDDPTPGERLHADGFQAGIRLIVADLAPGIPDLAVDVARGVGVLDDAAIAFRGVFLERFLSHLGQVLSDWELPAAEALIERVRNEAA